MAEQTVGFFVSVETNTPCNMPNRSQPGAVHAMLVPVLFFFRAACTNECSVDGHSEETQTANISPQKTTCNLFTCTNPTQKETHHACSPAPAYTVSPAPWSVDGGLLFVASLFPVRSGK